MDCAAIPGYTLAAANTQQENDFIYNNIALSLNPPDDAIWLGGTDYCDTNMDLINDCEGAWSWVTGDNWAYTNWAPDICCGPEPNNFGGNEHCLETGRNGDPTWNDVDCASLNYYVCEWNG